MKKRIKKIFNKFHIYRYLAYRKHKNDVLKNPKKEADRAYSIYFKKKINWDNPKNLIEKIYWLQFNSDTSLWTKYADKYKVRDYVKKCGYEENLPKLFGKWDKPEDIIFNELPNSFVLKTNNGCGTVLIVKDKLKLNIKSIKKKLSYWLSITYGYGGAQLHYTKIKPCIIAEELLPHSKEDKIISPNSLIDYKIWCFHGVPECILVVFNRFKDNYQLSLFDLEWNNISKENFNVKSKHYNGKDIPEPKSLKKMIEIAKALSQNFPQVRVDFYNINDKPYIGEMTFTTGFDYFSKSYYNYLGSKIDLNRINQL